MENRFGAPASGTPEERSARREFELLLLLGGSRKGAVQLWKWERRQRIYANAQQAAGRLATEAKGSRGAAERQLAPPCTVVHRARSRCLISRDLQMRRCKPSHPQYFHIKEHSQHKQCNHPPGPCVSVRGRELLTPF